MAPCSRFGERILTALEGRLCKPAHWVGQDPANMVWEGMRNAGKGCDVGGSEAEMHQGMTNIFYY